MNEDIIYTITAGNIDDNNWRCWAWFLTLEEAQRAIESCGDYLHDNYYSTLVIEEVPRGSITAEYVEWWYNWNGQEWRPSDKSQQIDTLSHFGIG